MLNDNDTKPRQQNNFLRLKRILPVMLGALAGYAYYYFIGCSSGSCPIQSNPYFSTLYGALAGMIFAFPEKKRNTEEAAENGK